MVSRYRIRAATPQTNSTIGMTSVLGVLLTAASLRTRIATGCYLGERWRRLGDRVAPDELNADPDVSPRVPAYGGMSLHAAVGQLSPTPVLGSPLRLPPAQMSSAAQRHRLQPASPR